MNAKTSQKFEPTKKRKGVSSIFPMFPSFIGLFASLVSAANKSSASIGPRILVWMLGETDYLDLSRIANWYLLVAVVVAGVAFIAAMWAFIFKMLKN